MEGIWSILSTLGAVIAGLVFLGVILLFLNIKKVMQLVATPTEIHLKPVVDHKWKNAAKHESASALMRNNGFTDLGIFSIDEMQGVLVHGFVKPSQGQIGVIYEHPMIDHWIDFVAFYDDDGSLTSTNALQGGELDHKPGHEKFYFPKASTEFVFEKFVTETAKSTRNPKPLGSSAEAFVELFEKGYREEQIWRNAKGGPSEDEIRRVAAASGKKYSDEVFEESRRVEERKAYEGLSKTLKNQLHAKSVHWDQEEDELVFIHDNLSASLLRELFHRSKEYGDMGSRIKDVAPPRETFYTWNISLGPSKSFIKIAELDEPLKVDVYKAPR